MRGHCVCTLILASEPSQTEVTRADVRDLVVEITALGKSRSVARNLLAPVRQTFNQLIDDGLNVRESRCLGRISLLCSSADRSRHRGTLETDAHARAHRLTGRLAQINAGLVHAQAGSSADSFEQGWRLDCVTANAARRSGSYGTACRMSLGRTIHGPLQPPCMSSEASL
jgi:hypothetical protein